MTFLGNPTIVYCCKGMVHLCYAIWSIRSLLRFGYQPIQVIVATRKEAEFFRAHCPGISCSILNAKTGDYPAFSYKPFILTKYIESMGIQLWDQAVVICDADILWRQDPRPLFVRFNSQNWVHKISAVSPDDFEMPLDQVPSSNIGLRTILHYRHRFGMVRYPNFIVNAGLFMLSGELFFEVLRRWMDKICRMPAKEMLMSEALLSVTYAEMGVVPVSDREDIKHLGVERVSSKLPIFSFEVAAERGEGRFTGYETAQHYYGNQRPFLHRDAVALGLDGDHLLALVGRELRRAKLRRLRQAPARALRRLRRALLG